MTDRKVLVCVCLFVLSLSLVGRLLERRSGNLTVTVFDVGQGDSISLTFPSGETMLVDAPGGSEHWNLGERVVLPELLREGTLTLDYAVMTHPDADHANGLQPILSRLRVKNFVYSDQAINNPITQKLAGMVVAQGGRALQIQHPVSFQIGEVAVNWMRASHLPVIKPKANDGSLVTIIKFGRCHVLLAGDIEKKSEQALIRQFPGSVDLLKVAHHGSRTSSTDAFLEKVNPQLAVISVGWRNRYRHPHPMVVSRLLERNISVLRTDVDGFIQIRVDREGEMHCRSWHGECGTYHCGGSSRSIRLNEARRSLSPAAFSN